MKLIKKDNVADLVPSYVRRNIAFSELHNKFREFKLKGEQIANDSHNDSLRTELGKEIYQYTKTFLDENDSFIMSLDTANVFLWYRNLWVQAKCMLDIADTEYASKYQYSKFGTERSAYNPSLPMTAGLNLSGAILYFNITGYIFLDVNFNKVEITHSSITHSHFENCDMSGLNAIRTDFNQSRFVNCQLPGSNLKHSNFKEAEFIECNLQGADLRDANLHQVFFTRCKTEPIIPASKLSSLFKHSHQYDYPLKTTMSLEESLKLTK